MSEQQINYRDFKRDLSSTLNQFSVDAYCNTNDFILAEYLIDCIEAFKKLSDNNKEMRSSGGSQ